MMFGGVETAVLEFGGAIAATVTPVVVTAAQQQLPMMGVGN
jgi:hypothetical protein